MSPSFTGLLIVAAVASAVPLLLALVPHVHVPGGALELPSGRPRPAGAALPPGAGGR